MKYSLYPSTNIIFTALFATVIFHRNSRLVSTKEDQSKPSTTTIKTTLFYCMDLNFFCCLQIYGIFYLNNPNICGILSSKI